MILISGVLLFFHPRGVQYEQTTAMMYMGQPIGSADHDGGPTSCYVPAATTGAAASDEADVPAAGWSSIQSGIQSGLLEPVAGVFCRVLLRMPINVKTLDIFMQRSQPYSG